MSRTKFGPEFAPEPINGNDPEFESFMSAALEGRPKLHFAPDLVAIYEAAKLEVSDHYSMDVTILPADHDNGDKPSSAADTRAMSEPQDYRHELSIRDEQIRREMDLRQESFRAEQAVRDKALEERFAGFFAAQSERDKAFEKVSDARFDRIERDVASIKADTKTVSLEVVGIRLVIARYVGGAIVVVAIASAALTAGSKYLFS